MPALAPKLKRGVGLGLVSYGVDAVVSTFMFPLLLRHLGKTEAGVWMVFTSLGALFGCLQSGLTPAVTREIAGVLGQSEGAEFETTKWGRARSSIDRLYGILLIGVAVLGLVLIPAYLQFVAGSNALSVSLIAIIWCGFLGGWLARAVVTRNFAVLDGLGEVGLNRVASTVAGVINLALLLVLLPMGLGAGAPVLSYLLVSLLLLGASFMLLNRRVPPGWHVRAYASREETWHMAADVGRLFVLGMTAYVVTQSCVLMVERTEGTASVAIFAPVVRVVQLLAGAACMPNPMLLPYLTKAWSAKDAVGFRRLCFVTICAAPMLYLVPGLILAIYPLEIFSLWLGADNFVGESTVRLLVLYGFIFTLHSSVALPAIASRHRSFMREAIINMLLVAALMPLLASHYGLIGYPLGMILGTVVSSVMVLWQSVRFLRQEFSR